VALKPILNLGAAVVGCYCFTYQVTGPSTCFRFAHISLLLFVFAIPLFGQSNIGELRLKVADPDGLGVKTTVHIVSAANQYRNNLATGERLTNTPVRQALVSTVENFWSGKTAIEG
jgi:hypothetical protein